MTVTGHVVVGGVTYAPTCSLTLPTSAFPDGSNTGVPAGVVLTQVPGHATSGQGWVWQANASEVRATASGVISGLDIAGGFNANGHANVTLQNSRVRLNGVGKGEAGVILSTGCVLTDCEIGGGSNGATMMGGLAAYSRGTQAAPNVISRCNIHHAIHGPHLDGDTLMADCWVHDLPMGQAPFQSDHTDGVFVSTGWRITIRHNSFSHGNNACVFVDDYDGDAQGVGDFIVEGNLFTAVVVNGQQSSFGVSVANLDIKGPITVRGNTFTRAGWQVGPGQAPAGTTQSGNVYLDGTSTGPLGIS